MKINALTLHILISKKKKKLKSSKEIHKNMP